MKKKPNRSAGTRAEPKRQKNAGFLDFAKKTGISTLCMQYALADKDTPTHARSIIKTALFYVARPLKAGSIRFPARFVDDVSVLTAAAKAVAQHIKQEHTKKAERDFRKLAAESRSGLQ